MREFEIQFTTKTAGPTGHHEKIVTEVGGATWRMKRDPAIDWLKADPHTFYVKEGEQKIYLVVATHNDKSWLRTSRDWEQPNLLLNLPEFPKE